MSCRSCPLDRRPAKPVKKRLGSIQEELQKSFPTADNLPENTPDHLEPENAAQKRHSEENVHDELQRSVKTPSNLQRKVAFCPPRRRPAPLLRCNMSDLKSVYSTYTLAVQPGVARAFALRVELGRFAPLALLSFVASRLLNPEMNRLPMEKDCSSLSLHNSSFYFGKRSHFNFEW